MCLGVVFEACRYILCQFVNSGYLGVIMSIHSDVWRVKKCKRLVFCLVNGMLLVINLCIYSRVTIKLIK